jgi:predicted DNA-binding transcriptional regulator YafY
MSHNRLQQLLRIVNLVLGDRQMTPLKLSGVLNCEERSVFRYLNDLREGGIDIQFDKDQGGYRILKSCFLRPLELQLDEAIALMILASRTQLTGDPAQTKPAQRGIEKIRAMLNPTVGDDLNELLKHTTVDTARSENAGAYDTLTLVQQAIATKRALECIYRSSRDDFHQQRFVLRPYSLYFGQRAWYVIGLHDHSQPPRTFKLSRFEMCNPTDKPYHLPDDFSLATYFGKAWRMIPGSDRHDITLRFDPNVAATVADTWWHDTQRVENQPDGSKLIHFQVDGLDEITWWILSYGRHCQVITPDVLKQRVRSELQSALKQY